MKKNELYLKGLLLGMLFNVFCTNAQTEKDKMSITSSYDKAKLELLKERFALKEKQQKDKAILFAKQNNIPILQTLKDGGLAELQKIESDGTLIYYRTFNTTAAKATRANHLHSGGSLGLDLNGKNMIAHVWDGGIARVSHQEYDGDGGENRVSVADGTTRLHYHAAHVTGTIAASGFVANAKGMAPHSKVKGYDWNNDLSEAASAAASGMLISNHSYGYDSEVIPDYYFGAYIGESEDWDDLLFNAPNYLMVVAAGNDGSSNFNAKPLNPDLATFDKLTGYATSKNNLVVANANDPVINNDGILQSVRINSSSSQGPTDDLRIKPDITGNGTGLYSTYESADDIYQSITGTSMASPNVSGSLLLLQEHYKNVNNSYMRASTLKGLALHTADDAGTTGPDANFGWGLLNVKKAAETINQMNDNTIIQELELENEKSYSFQVNSDGVSKLMATICWTDPAANSTTDLNSDSSKLVNDLDIRITNSNNTYYPWRLKDVNANELGDNTKDNVERAEVNNASGEYTITITHKGSLKNLKQNYSLIVTGLESTTIVCNASLPTGVVVENVTRNSANVKWNTIANTSYEIKYKTSTTNNWTTRNSNSNSLVLNNLSPNTVYEVQVKSICSNGTSSSFTSSIRFTTLSDADTSAPSKPLNLVASETTAISTKLSWSVANDNVAVTGYDIFQGNTAIASATTNSFVVNGLTPATTYTFKVRAKDAAGNLSTFSNIINVVTKDLEDTNAPSKPLNLVASETTAISTKLSWTASNDNIAVTGYDIFQGNTAIASATTNSFVVNGLTPATAYTFKVRAKDAAGNTSDFSNQLNVNTIATPVDEYCYSTGESTLNEMITNVSLGAINNPSSGSAGYENFTNISTTAAIGSEQTITVVNTKATSSTREAYALYIDYNKNGSFLDPGEKVFTRSASMAAQFTMNFTIPRSATLGKTRMRISMKNNAIPTACEVFPNGQVEDYSIIITPEIKSTNEEMVSVEDKIEFEIYPNPVYDVINFNTKNIANASFKIYNFLGQIVLSNQLVNSLNVNHLPKGIYRLELVNGLETISKKFIKN